MNDASSRHGEYDVFPCAADDWADLTPVCDVSDLTCARFTEPVEERDGFEPAQERAA